MKRQALFRAFGVVAVALVAATPPTPARVSSPPLFEERAAALGLKFTPTRGAAGRKVMVETTQGGAGWLDFDGDGFLDVYVVNGHDDSTASKERGKRRNALFRNENGERFTDVTEAAGAGDDHYGMGVAVGDYDNDGDPDLYVANVGRNTLLENRGDGTFRDVTETAGVGDRRWSSSVAFVDVDADGLLDIYVVNYLRYDAVTATPCEARGRRVYCSPRRLTGERDTLYRNVGGGRFEDVTLPAGIGASGDGSGKGLGILPFDYDDDGRVDIYVANDTTANFLWKNAGNGKFTEEALIAGMAFDGNGNPQAGMGVDVGDVDGDGRLDLYVTNFALETNCLYRNAGGGFFDDATTRFALGKPTYALLGFGTRLLDADLDGDIDIYVACGHIEDDVERLEPGSGQTFRQPDLLLVNDGKGRFEPAKSLAAGRWFDEVHAGRAVASADFDNDGDEDLLVTQLDEPLALLVNNTRRAGRKGGRPFLSVRLVGGAGASASEGKWSARDGYGARVTLSAAGHRQVAECQSARSYQAACDPRLHFGFADAGVKTVNLDVRWPSGRRQEFVAVPVDRHLVISEMSGIVEGR